MRQFPRTPSYDKKNSKAEYVEFNQGLLLFDNFKYNSMVGWAGMREAERNCLQNGSLASSDLK